MKQAHSAQASLSCIEQIHEKVSQFSTVLFDLFVFRMILEKITYFHVYMFYTFKHSWLGDNINSKNRVLQTTIVSNICADIKREGHFFNSEKNYQTISAAWMHLS